jgi:hypothetical protein
MDSLTAPELIPDKNSILDEIVRLGMILDSFQPPMPTTILVMQYRFPRSKRRRIRRKWAKRLMNYRVP